MKRAVCLGTMLIMMGMNACAWAAFDLKPYMYDENSVVPVDRETMLIVQSDDEAHRVSLVWQGETVRETTLEKRNDRINTVIGTDGNIGLITRPDFAYGEAPQAYYRWSEEGALAHPVPLSDDAGYLYACGNGFYGAQSKGNIEEVFVCDADGREIFTRPFVRGEDEHISPMTCVRDADGSYLLAVYTDDPGAEEDMIRVERMDAFGEVIWQTVFPGRYGYDACVLSGDGEGGAFLVKTDDQNYKLVQIYRIDGQGNLLWTRQVEAEGLILSAFCGGYDAGEGGLVIDGNVVSKSKGVYRVVRLVISGEGTLVSASAKDFSSRPDYGFAVMRAADGSVFAQSGANYLDTKNTKHVLVPVDVLPEAEVPELVIR